MDNRPTLLKRSAAMTEIEKKANQWLILLHSGEATQQDVRAFKQWLQASRCHADTFRKAESLWRMTRYSQSLQATEAASSNHKSAYRYGSMATAAVLLIACVLFFQWQPVTLKQDEQLLTTAVGQIHTFVLADNSSVTLGADSKVSVWFDDAQRNTRLIQGDALFDVQSDPQRPFVTYIDDAHVTVLGTRYEVQKRPYQTSVTVGHGKVNVAKQRQAVNLTPGQKVNLNNDKISEVMSVEPDFFAQWKQHRFTFSNHTLEDVVSVINRHRTTPVRIVTPTLRTLRVTAAFSAEQSVQVLESMARQYEFEINTTPV
jgi:transmembrane sensor